MIIDTHAHALDAEFLQGLCRTPRFGLSADRDTAGRFCVRRGDGAPVSLDDDLSNIPRRIESLRRRNVGLQLIGPPPGFASWPGGAASVEYARTLNEHGARVVAQGQGHLELMVTLPLGEPESCAYELERALDLYGARSRPCCRQRPAGGRSIPAHLMACSAWQRDAEYCCSCIRYRQSRHRAFRSTHCNSSCNGRQRLHSPLHA